MTRPLLIFYEHPDWFRPLFAELDRRGTPYLRVHADGHWFDPSRQPPLVSAAFNRMSPSAWRRGRGGAIFATHDYIGWLEAHRIDVFNGSHAFRMETSKAAQIDVGGIEYLESDRDGAIYFYDINALSNFVADPVQVIGFDPTARLVDALEDVMERKAVA